MMGELGRSARRIGAAALAAALLVAAGHRAQAFPVKGDKGLLPEGTELNEEAAEQPREIFRSVDEEGGKRSYLLNLGDMAFSSPEIFGGVAKQAGISCSTCHVNGANNPKFYMPGLSTRHGNFDPSGALFNAKADDGVLDPVVIPSLRGAKFFAPYGHDGRTASLRQFIRNVIVEEFAGPEPSPELLDGLVIYVQDIALLPNPRLTPEGRLTSKASASEKRGEKLFMKPFPDQAGSNQTGMSCGTCHIPSAGFVDHRQHDVGSGSMFKTPTLLNADFNAPYFHDGRYDTYTQVVEHFDRQFRLGLSPQDRADLVAYLKAVGDGEEPYQPVSLQADIDEVQNFIGVLDTALPEHNTAVALLTVDTVGGELRELTEQFPQRKDTSVQGGQKERSAARGALKELVLALRRIGDAAAKGHFDDAQAGYDSYREQFAAAVPLLKAAEPWSLFNPEIRRNHYLAVRQLLQAADAR